EYHPDLCSRVPYTYIAFVGVCLAISLCGLVGNGMIMWFLGFQMKQNPFTVYIRNLAVADFSLLLLFFMLLLDPLIFAAFCTSLLYFLYQNWRLAFTFHFLYQLFDLSSLVLLTALSVDHCVSVL
ncbi:MAS protein, partial [Origma solitaria]|nr:MAS protein [Origma solitaria]